MADTSFLDWPFFEARHRDLGRASWTLGRGLNLAGSTTVM